MKKALLLVLSLGIAASYSDATVWFVKADATGANTGVSWSNAFASLQSGINASIAGDTIWVANGTYKPTTTTSRTTSFQLPSSVAVFGGFAGTESLLSQRNFSGYQTVLSGDIGTVGVHSDDVYNVVKVGAVSAQTRLDGFKVIYGNANGSSISNTTGGGINITAGSPTIANCYFIENQAGSGAGIYANGLTVDIRNCTFSSNTATRGGGVYSGSGVVNILDCSFSGNQADYGGAYYGYGGTTLIDRCSISGNSASVTGGAIDGSTPALTVTNTLIAGNTASDYAVFHQFVGSTNPVSFINCTIAHNKTVSTVNSFLMDLAQGNTVRNSIIWGNIAPDFDLLTPTISNTVFQGGYPAGTAIDTNNPLFVSPALAASAPFNASAYNYRVGALSFTIDTGVASYLPVLATTDLGGNPRISGSKVDLGAYESSFCSFAPTVAPSGPALVCPGGNLQLVAGGGSSYRWMTGSNTAATLVSSPGTYKVIAVNSSGCRGTAAVLVTGSTTQLQLLAPSIYLCPGSSVVLEAVGQNIASVLWSNGATTAIINPTATGLYKVTVTGNDGCMLKDSVSIVAGMVPAPTISYVNGILQAGVFASYQWQLGGADISGATGQSYSPAVNGSYAVRVTNTMGCAGTSAAKAVSNVSVRQLSNSGALRVYPNPASRQLSILTENKLPNSAQLQLIGSSGQVVYQSALGKLAGGSELRLDVSAFPAGLYQLLIRTEERTYSCRIQIAAQ